MTSRPSRALRRLILAWLDDADLDQLVAALETVEIRRRLPDDAARFVDVARFALDRGDDVIAAEAIRGVFEALGAGLVARTRSLRLAADIQFRRR